MSEKNKRRVRGRGAILTIALLLISSALMRLGAGTGQAVAQALAQPVKGVAGAKPNMATEDIATDPSNEAVLDRVETGNLLSALKQREERVKALEQQIDVRRKALEVADAEISKRLAILEQAEANLRQTIALADGAAEDDLTNLTAVYENMKPKDAATLFATMEPGFAAGFLGRMRPDAAAAIMTGLPPEVAYSISAILAGRNAKVPKS